MGYDTRSRDLSRWAVTGISGAVAAGVLVGTGAITGEAARLHRAQERADHQREAEEYAAWLAERAAYDAELARAEEADPRVVVRQRPRRTRVTTRYITVAGPGAVAVGPAGTAPRSAGGGGSSGESPRGGGAGSGGGGASSGGGGGGGGGGASGPTPGPPPPPPPPPPASSGS